MPEGLLVDAAWLERHGYSKGLRKKYIEHGWLELVAPRVYRRRSANGTPPDAGLRWQQVVISLQTLLQCPLAVGGRTALELQGFSHYLSAASPREVHLYGSSRLPAWVARVKAESRFVFHNSARLFEGDFTCWNLGTGNRRSKTDADRLPGSLTRHPSGHWDWPLVVSTPERAILEALDEVPQRETFHQADMLMEGLRTLSPRRLDKLLKECRSVKVKRLFLWFAERHNQPWLKALHTREIDLGRGKRMLVRGGRLDPKFNITVPENLNAGG